MHFVIFSSDAFPNGFISASCRGRKTGFRYGISFYLRLSVTALTGRRSLFSTALSGIVTMSFSSLGVQTPSLVSTGFPRRAPLHGPRNRAVAVATNPDRAEQFAEQELPWSGGVRMIWTKQQFRLLRFDRLMNSDIAGPPTADSEKQPLRLGSRSRASDAVRDLADRPCTAA